MIPMIHVPILIILSSRLFSVFFYQTMPRRSSAALLAALAPGIALGVNLRHTMNFGFDDGPNDMMHVGGATLPTRHHVGVSGRERRPKQNNYVAYISLLVAFSGRCSLLNNIRSSRVVNKAQACHDCRLRLSAVCVVDDWWGYFSGIDVIFYFGTIFD